MKIRPSFLTLEFKKYVYLFKLNKEWNGLTAGAGAGGPEKPGGGGTQKPGGGFTDTLSVWGQDYIDTYW